MKPWFLLNSSMECIAILDPSIPHGFPYEEDVLTDKLAFASKTLEFKVSASHSSAKKLTTEGSFIYIPHRKNPELFVVLETEEEKGGIRQVWCEPTYISELGGCVVRSMQLKSATLEHTMNSVLTGSGWSLGKNEGKGIRDITFPEPLSVLEAIHEISQAYGFEIQFSLLMDGFRIKQKRVDAVKRRGKIIARPVEVDEEEMELKKVVDRKELITALIGIGPQKEDGSFLTFQDYTPATTKGMEKKEDWVGDIRAKERWGNGRHLFGVYRDENAQNPVELYRNTLRELKKRARSTISYTLQVSNVKKIGEEVMVGDTLLVKTERGREPVKMRVTERRTSMIDPEKSSLTLEQT